MSEPVTQSAPRPSLKVLEEAITSLERAYGQSLHVAADRNRQQATLVFLGGLKELVRAFCLQGSPDGAELGYIPFSLRE